LACGVCSEAARQVIIGRLIGHRAGFPGPSATHSTVPAACDALGNTAYIARFPRHANRTGASKRLYDHKNDNEYHQKRRDFVQDTVEAGGLVVTVLGKGAHAADEIAMQA